MAEEVKWSEVFDKAKNRAFRGGISGAAAMTIQVVSLIWMRTTMNYQYRYGTSTREAMKTLYKEGGIRRFYRGVGPALLQGPLSRFGDTAANAGMLAVLNGHPSTVDLPIGVKTLGASAAAAGWRIFLMPIDTVKTTLQVEGPTALKKLGAKAAKGGPTVFYHGALGASGATFVGHYPWFGTFNYLQEKIPEMDTTLAKLGRNAVIGFTASVVSDCTSNSIRVVKTYRQTHTEVVTYPTAVKQIVAQEGIFGLLGRGLQTRILANGMQGLLFSVLWKAIDEEFFGKKK